MAKKNTKKTIENTTNEEIEIVSVNTNVNVDDIMENITKNIPEEINVITSLNFNPNRLKIVMGKNALEIYGLMYNIDINTSPINLQTRIDAKFIDEFYSQAISLLKNIEEVY